MALRDEIHEQTIKLKDMTFKEKRAYIWEYYKWWIIGTLAVILAICSITKSVINNSRPVYLNATFINCLVTYNEATPTIEQDFVDACNIDTQTYNLNFDYNTFLDGQYTNPNSYTSQVRLMSQYSAGTLDIVCGPESTLTGDADVGAYTNLEEVLPPGMLDELYEKGYEPFYYTEILDTAAQDEIAFEIMNAENEGKEISPETQKKIDELKKVTYIGGIYIDNCDYLNSQGEHGIYSKEAEDRAVLTIAAGSQNIDHAIEFIQFITK